VTSSFTTINSYAFADCRAFSSVDLSAADSLRLIGGSAFRLSGSLVNLTLGAATPPVLVSTTALMLTANPTDPNALVIYVPQGSVENYKAANNWAYFADKIRAIAH
ncbi:MAG: leucine-rich repeat domain-containing protein, partial [Treponema sp.]|nr:leucine-rich repeat domain-containing protein [Treponema sp.]